MEGTEHIRQDRVTQRLHECGQLLGIELLDQIILGDNRFVSLKERGVFSSLKCAPGASQSLRIEIDILIDFRQRKRNRRRGERDGCLQSNGQYWQP